MPFVLALAALPIAARADPDPEASEAALLSGARQTLARAGGVFREDNGKGVLETEIPDDQGKFRTIQIDAVPGEILAHGRRQGRRKGRWRNG